MHANLLPFYIFLTNLYFLPIHIMEFMELVAHLMCSLVVLQTLVKAQTQVLFERGCGQVPY